MVTTPLRTDRRRRRANPLVEAVVGSILAATAVAGAGWAVSHGEPGNPPAPTERTPDTPPAYEPG